MIMNTEIKKAQNEFTETETEIQRLKNQEMFSDIANQFKETRLKNLQNKLEEIAIKLTVLRHEYNY
jgi:anthranilate/para-aminobenzoate synthase component II